MKTIKKMTYKSYYFSNATVILAGFLLSFPPSFYILSRIIGKVNQL